jgi:hypothetical protein
MTNNKTLNVKGTDVVLFRNNETDYISLTDMARYRDPDRSDYLIQNWMRTGATIEYLGLWERFNNPDFNSIEFDGIKNLTGSNSFSMTPKRWANDLGGIGIIAKTGRYGGTYAHRDIAFEFATWLSAEFKFYLVLEFERLKSAEQKRLSAEWNLSRTLAKVNYHIHTDAIKEHIIPQIVSVKQKSFTYANEADLLNVALFGKTATEWRAENPDSKGNIRDEATLEQLVVLSNLESINALLIRDGLPQSQRLAQLNITAIAQLKSLLTHSAIKQLKEKNEKSYK